MTASPNILAGAAAEPWRAQFGEDRILWHIFRQRPTGYFVDVGAYNGVDLSNTYFLERMGWHGLLIEPNRELAQQAASARPGSRVIAAACDRPGSPPTARFTIAQNVAVLSFLRADDEHRERCRREGAAFVEIDVPVRTLDALLMAERDEAPPDRSPWVANQGWRIDVVSLDTEGCELDVLAGFTLERFRPRVLVIENDGEDRQSLVDHLAGRGYRLFHRQVINDFFVRADDPASDLTLTGLDVVAS